MHTSAKNIENGLPEIISCYNLSKSAVDNMDHMICMYTSKRKCFRWPYRYFFNLVNVGLFNAAIILQQLNASTSQAKTNAFLFEFLMNVGYQLLHVIFQKDPLRHHLRQFFLQCLFLVTQALYVHLAFKWAIKENNKLAGVFNVADKKTTMKCSKLRKFHL